MSHIDSFKHEIVGLFGSLPVYHPLEAIEGDFKCMPHQLVLGGGSGEHPALVFEDLTACVALFLGDVSLRNKNLKFLGPVISSHLPDSIEELLTFYDWNEHTHQAFYAICTSEGLPNPYQPNYHKMGYEKWLLMGIGEFVFYACPNLCPILMNKLDNPYRYFNSSEYNNIMLIPPNVPVYANGGNLFFKKK